MWFESCISKIKRIWSCTKSFIYIKFEHPTHQVFSVFIKVIWKSIFDINDLLEHIIFISRGKRSFSTYQLKNYTCERPYVRGLWWSLTFKHFRGYIFLGTHESIPFLVFSFLFMVFNSERLLSFLRNVRCTKVTLILKLLTKSKCPDWVIKILAGFKSLWAMPFKCKYSKIPTSSATTNLTDTSGNF